ncbi:fumarylacetoacetate hydrolase family protein [Pseudomonas fulva]|uniref:fumarylacetoacetate hydrolase family protein n=1 Tax=Pseudomonas fulva TaxID=47880 RepID=UPI00201D9B1F|nr:fumarylacetoacetate hydrolase family protein [Pseudomonas fulva]UQY33007.1 fumarylacetoacetate hydrolase family protein [Pseudomonas fulva]
MKLLRFGPLGHEKPGILDDAGNIRDLSAHVRDLSGEVLSPEGLRKISELDLGQLPLVEENVRIGACVADVGKFVCIGLNYSDHAAETGSEVPSEPVVFMKPTSAIVGPYDNVRIPRGSNKTDWEVELGVVIGSAAKYVSPEDALEYVAGYCIVNDISERDYQFKRQGTWDKGKCCDTFGPIGPWLVSRDEIRDPQNLNLWLDVDGKRFQDGSTKTMVYDVSFLVSYLSQFMTLHPGDIISTGTPPGVGMGQRPEVYLRAGQKMRLGISGLGEQQQIAVQDE